MNNNRCLYCNEIIPEGRQICPLCEREMAQDGIAREITSAYGVTPENKYCLACKKKKCKGECADFKAFVARLRKQKLHKKQQNKGL